MAILADDVIMYGNAERGRDIDDRAGHLDVGLRLAFSGRKGLSLPPREENGNRVEDPHLSASKSVASIDPIVG
jgi:hypothetical protein